MPARSDHRPRLVHGVAVLALGLGALTACSSDEPDATAASTSVSSASSSSSAGSSAPASDGSAEAGAITATEADFSISLDEDSLSAGTYEIQVVNDGGATHDLVVEQDGSDIAASDNIAPGETATLTVDLAPGEYVFYCSIGNHRAMGMELTVEVT